MLTTYKRETIKEHQTKYSNNTASNVSTMRVQVDETG
jgi:hypothetical protein